MAEDYSLFLLGIFGPTRRDADRGVSPVGGGARRGQLVVLLLGAFAFTFTHLFQVYTCSQFTMFTTAELQDARQRGVPGGVHLPALPHLLHARRHGRERRGAHRGEET